ncbi:MAG: ferrochelatase [Chloroflexota bacterium]
MADRSRDPIGVVLMTFGSAATPEEVPAYLARVRGGRSAPAELVAEFQRRYELVGWSPLIDLTGRQAAALEAELNRRHPEGPRYAVTIGMLHSPPFVAEAIGDLADRGARELIAVILSPQYSPYIMGGYHRAVDDAVAALAANGRDLSVRVAGPWYRNPLFLDALTDRIREALARFPEDVRGTVPVLLTSHSLPKRVVEREPEYLDQIQETVRLLVERVGLSNDRWQFAYQSAGHTPEEWLKPDMKDLLPGLYDAGHRHVLMSPVQFLSDHLEILYDIDVAAREEAERLGMRFERIESLNLSPTFIEALAEVVEETERAEADL